MPMPMVALVGEQMDRWVRGWVGGRVIIGFGCICDTVGGCICVCGGGGL